MKRKNKHSKLIKALNNNKMSSKGFAQKYFIKYLIAEKNGWCYYYDGRTFEAQWRLENKIRRRDLTVEEIELMFELDYLKIYLSKCDLPPMTRPNRSYEFNPFSMSGYGRVNMPKKYCGRL